MIFNRLITILFLSFFITQYVNAENECFEKTSRVIFKFNQVIDKNILEPVAKGYNKLPTAIKNGTGNFTSNLGTLLSIPNFVLQGEFREAGDATMSFAINSTVGILGLGNPAKKLGFEVQQEDLGQTLGSYGLGGGCYFVMPLFGPTTLRDAVGMVADTYIDPFATATWREKEFLKVSGNKMDYLAVKSATVVDFRGDNMVNFESLRKNSIDLYAAQKSFYLQNMEKKIKNSLSSNDDDLKGLDN